MLARGDGDAGPGHVRRNPFQPNSTWWDKSTPFLAYINRCQYLLQQGLFVADVCYYYGDHVPNYAQLKKSDPARLLPGYDYDVATEEVVLTRMNVEDGRIVLPDGMSYRLLVLQDRTNISLPVLRKIKQLVEAGATVLGPKPQTATGLRDFPRCDEEVRAIVSEVWGPCDAEAVTMHAFGKGRVIWDNTAREVFAADHIAPDVEFRADVNGQQPSAATMDWIHRRAGDTDIFFVCSQQASPRTIEAVFRVRGKQPELWDPVTGSRRDAVVFLASKRTDRDSVGLSALRFAVRGVSHAGLGNPGRHRQEQCNRFVEGCRYRRALGGVVRSSLGRTGKSRF